MPYPLHAVTAEYADIPAKEFARIRDDIREHGQRYPIVVWRGQIVDGRHRDMICRELGIEVKIEDISDECPTEQDMIERVRSLNQHRRSRTEPLSNREKRERIEAELKADPERSDRAIAAIVGVDHTFVGRLRKTNGVVQNTTPPENRVASNGKRGGGGRKGSNAGSRLKVPPGKTVSDIVHCGLAAERGDDLEIEAAAKLAGIGTQSYREARTIVLLGERTDLNKTDTAIAHRALQMLNTTCRSTAAYKLVRPIAAKVWGGGKGARRNAENEKRRIVAFEKAITIITEACASGERIPLPHLNSEQAANAMTHLNEAGRSLRRLYARVKGESK
jgi:ParB/Sulfiredoxin domain